MSNADKYKHLSLEIKKSDYKYVLFSSSPDLSNFNSLTSYCLFVSPGEYSGVFPADALLTSVEKEEVAWSCLQIIGEMPFGSVQGLIAEVSGCLASESIGVCVVSTFKTDYFFLRSKNLKKARELLSGIGWKFSEEK